MFTVKNLFGNFLKFIKNCFLSSVLLILAFISLLFVIILIDILCKNFKIDGFAPIIKFLYFIFFVSPLYYGICLWFAEIAKEKRHKIWEAFGFYTSFKLIFRSAFHILIHLILFSINLVPSFIFFFSANISYRLALNTADTLLFILSLSFGVISACLLFLGLISYSKYSLATYIFVTHPDVKITKTFSLSKKATKGMLSDTFLYKFKLNLALLPLMVFFPLGVGTKCVSLSEHYNSLCCLDAYLIDK